MTGYWVVGFIFIAGFGAIGIDLLLGLGERRFGRDNTEPDAAGEISYQCERS